MKRLFTLILLLPVLAQAGMVATTVPGFPACASKAYLADMIQFASSGDRASFNAYIRTGKCAVMKTKMRVTVTESPGFMGSQAQFVIEGNKLWTHRKGLENYRLSD